MSIDRRPETGSEPELDADIVRRHIAAILATDRFDRSPRSSAILRFTVEETLAGRTFQINARTIAANAFEAEQGESPLSEAAVRVAVGRLRRSLRDHYEDHRADAVMITIPIGSYVPRIEAMREARPMIAVSTLVDHGVVREHAHLATVIPDGVAARLAKGTEFQVFRDVGPTIDASSAAGANHNEPGYRLSGSIRSVGDTTRVDLQLQSDAAGILWTRTMHRPPGGASTAEFEDSVVSHAVGALGDHTGVVNRHWLTMREADSDRVVADAWSRYLDYSNWLDDERFWDALRALRRVVGDDSDPHLQAALSQLCSVASVFEPSNADAHLDEAARLARRAVALAPNDTYTAHAMASLALVRGELGTAQREYARLAALPSVNPSMLCQAGMGTIITSGTWEEGIAMIERAVELNPQHHGIWMLYPALDRYRRGDFVAAADAVRSVHLPSIPIGEILRAAVFVRLGELPSAVVALRDGGIESSADLDEAMEAVRARFFAPGDLADQLEHDARIAVVAH